MDVETVLFILRLLSLVLLLGFVGAVGWFLLQDVRQTAAATHLQQKQYGTLRLYEGDDMTQTAVYPLLPLTKIGRAESSTIVLDDGYVSNEHSMITLRDGRWWLQDLGSRNGTLLNELLLQETAVLSTGDIITIGNTKIKVELN